MSWSSLCEAFEVENHYLCRSTEPIKLSATIRFVQRHDLAELLNEELLFRPVIAALNEGHPQIAYNLVENHQLLQLRLVAFAIQKGFRLSAGRLIDRFGPFAPEVHQVVPNWSGLVSQSPVKGPFSVGFGPFKRQPRRKRGE